jgi:predicted TIM-barrel fold metal-dependent hydrolase
MCEHNRQRGETSASGARSKDLTPHLQSRLKGNHVAHNLTPLISADSHVEEPPELWWGELSSEDREKLPPEMRPTESGSQFALRVGANESRELTPAEIEGERHRQMTSSLGTTNLDSRFKIMSQENVVGECIYPTKGLYLWGMEDRALGLHCAKIYNDWIYDLLESRSPRFRCAGIIPTWDVGDAIKEIQRCAAMGLGAIHLPIVGNPPWNARQWDPMWAAIAETGLPVVLHQGTGHDMLFYRGRGASVANLLATQSMAPRTAGLLATSGVLHDHPNLHFIFVETNASWISWAMTTLDHYTEAFAMNVGWVRPELPEPPSFYIKRQIHGTFQKDDVAITNVPFTGPAVALWGSDYPHTEGTYPHSQDVVAEFSKNLSPTDAETIVFGTAAKLFNFDKEKILQPF